MIYDKVIKQRKLDNMISSIVDRSLNSKVLFNIRREAEKDRISKMKLDYIVACLYEDFL